MTALNRSFFLLAVVLCFYALSARADMALLVEDPAGYKGFLSDSGHLAIWIDNACVGPEGVVRLCSGGTGAVLSSTSYWTRPGWAAIPAQTYLGGTAGVDEDTTAWTETLHETYPQVPLTFGRKYIGRLRHRGCYVIRIHTSPEQDARVIEQIQQGRSRFRYRVLVNNCSDFARQVLELYFPSRFGRRVFPDFGISTPHGVANRFWKLGRDRPGLNMQIYYLARLTPAGYLHDGRTKGICEAAITDVKYALPLVFYQPMIYAAFGICYLATDHPSFMHGGFAHDAVGISSFEQISLDYLIAHPLAVDGAKEAGINTTEWFDPVSGASSHETRSPGE